MADDARGAWRSLLWRSWESLGVSSWERGAPESVIDPEALLAGTLAGDDERLQLETIDWGIHHLHLIHRRRLVALSKWLQVETRAHDWIAASESAEARMAQGVEPTGKSSTRSVPFAPRAATFALRWRGISGTTARSEIIRAMHPVVIGTHGPMTITDLVERLGLTRPHVTRAVNELVEAGVLGGTGSPRRRHYAPVEPDDLGATVWRAWRNAPFAPWSTIVELSTLLVQARALLDDPTVGNVAEALERFERGTARLELLTGIRPPTPEPGPAIEVGPRLAKIIDELVEDLISRLIRPTRRPQTPAPHSWSSAWGEFRWTNERAR